METDMRLSLLHEEMTLYEYLGPGIPVLVVVAVPTGVRSRLAASGTLGR